MNKKFTIPFLLIILFAGNIQKTYSQKRFEVAGGYGWPNLFNVHILYGDQVKAGISAGFLKTGNNSTLGPLLYEYCITKQVSLDVYYSLSGKYKFSKLRPWYVNGGLSYFYTKDLNGLQDADLNDQEVISPYVRGGREIYFSKRTGLRLNLGAQLPFILSTNHKKYEFNKIFPAAGISVFVRL